MIQQKILFYYKIINAQINRLRFICKSKEKLVSEFVYVRLCCCKRAKALLVFFKKIIGKIKIFQTNINNFVYLKLGNSYTFIMLLLTKKFDTHEKINELFDKVEDAEGQKRMRLLLRGFSNAMRHKRTPAKLTKDPSIPEDKKIVKEAYIYLKEKVKEVSLTKDPSGKDYAKFEQAFFELNREFSRQFCHFLVKSGLTMEEYEKLTWVDEEIIKSSGVKTLRKMFFLLSDKFIIMHVKIQNALQLCGLKNIEEATTLASQFTDIYKDIDISKLVDSALILRQQLHLLSDTSSAFFQKQYFFAMAIERIDWTKHYTNIWTGKQQKFKQWKFFTENIDIQVINDYKIFIVFVFSAIALSLLITNISRFIGNSLMNFERSKISVYECGFQPFEQLDKSQLFIFYRLSIIFIIFEAELIFLYPWILQIAHQTTFYNSINYYYSPIFFIFVIIYGFYYEIKHKALDI